MSPAIAACAALVERGDPDRFLATMAAPPAARARLWPLYACNLELACIPWLTAEPMLAEMRLQWWVDTFRAGRVPGHEVAGPLMELVVEAGLPVDVLVAMAEARLADVWKEGFADAGALVAHIDATAGNLMWLAARALGAAGGAESVVRDFAIGSGLAAWFRAVPELAARGRDPLPPGDPAALVALARDHLSRARAARSRVPAVAGPALLAGWRADATLRRLGQVPGRMHSGGLDEPEVTRRGTLLLRSLTGRW